MYPGILLERSIDWMGKMDIIRGIIKIQPLHSFKLGLEQTTVR